MGCLTRPEVPSLQIEGVGLDGHQSLLQAFALRGPVLSGILPVPEVVGEGSDYMNA